MSVKHVAMFAAAFGFSSFASATVMDVLLSNGAKVRPVIVAGAPPDSPVNRIDPNTAASAFNGVVSINIRYDGLSFICSGTVIGSRQVLTAGHCVDTDGNGSVIDITKPGNDVRVVLNASTIIGDPGRAIITANKVTMNPNYQGFGNCPSGVPGFCVNDDIAILQLSTDVPDYVTRYAISSVAPELESVFNLVGYGLSGNGIDGYTVGPDFRIKRSGANVFDLFETDDETNFDPTSQQEVWYYDFDGTKEEVNRDYFCQLPGLGVCSAQLANHIETHLGGGDSGGPSFILDSNGNYILVGNNTFGGNDLDFCNDNWAGSCVEGNFGDFGGGILLYSYLQWIHQTVPEPGALGLLALALLMMLSAASRRSRR